MNPNRGSARAIDSCLVERKERPPTPRRLIALGEGVYTVSEVCRILQPSMTPRRVHYWLDTELIGLPIKWGRRGHPTLLSFQQLLRIKTVQHLKDELRVSLPRVREAFAFVLDRLFADDWNALSFAIGVRHEIVVRSLDERVSIPMAQGILPHVIPELERYTFDTRKAWESRRLRIPHSQHLESNARVQSGSPVIVGTRLETASLAMFVEGREMASSETIGQIKRAHPYLEPLAVREALEFEGIELAA